MALDLTDDLIALEETFGQTIAWNGLDYPCHVSSSRRGSKLEEGGFAIESDLSVTIRTNLFPNTRPQKKHTFTYNSTRYRIDDVTTPAGGSFLRFTASHDSKGA